MFISEVLQDQLKLMKMDDLLDRVEKEPDFLAYLHSKFPEMRDFDRSNQKEISEAIHQFNLGAMVKYLTKRFNALSAGGEMAGIENKLRIGLTMVGVTKENSLTVYKLDGVFLPMLREFQSARRITGEQAK